MPEDNPPATRWTLSTNNKWRKESDHFSPTAAGSPGSSLLESDGAHLAETHPDYDLKTWKEILGDDRSLRNQEKKQPAPTSPKLTEPAVIAHSANLAETPQDVRKQSYHCPICSESWNECEQKAKDDIDIDSEQICGIFGCEKVYNAANRPESNFCSSACEKYWEEIQRGCPSACANPKCADASEPPHLPFCSIECSLEECKDAVQGPTTTPSDGAHHAETPQIVGDTQAATTSNLFTYYGGEKEANRQEKKAEAASGSGGSCNRKTAPDDSNADALPGVAVKSGYYCPSCCRCWKVGEEMPFGGLCDCSARSQLKEGIYSSDNALAVGCRMGIRVVTDAKIREQLRYAWNNMTQLIGSIAYIDGKINTAGLSGPLKDLFEGPLSDLLTELKSHHEIIIVLTSWAAQEGLPFLTDSNSTSSDLHPMFTPHRSDTHPTEQEGTLPPSTPPTQPPPRPPTSAANPAATSATTPAATPAANPAATPAATSADLSILPFHPPLNSPTIKSIFQHYNAGCVLNEESQQWAIPLTHALNLIDQFDWKKMLDCSDEFLQGRFIVSTIPTFYREEPDHNQRNKPRLDILVEFNDGITVRYHQGADHIWSTTPQPTTAMEKRYKLAAKLRRNFERTQR